MEDIARRAFDAKDRQEVHDAAIASATTRTAAHLEAYVRHSDSFAGRYVSADLFKETFEAFRETAEARNRYNAPVHNSATVLASEHLRRLLAHGAQPGDRAVVLLTGIPGAGKTSTVLNAGQFPAGTRAIYEGQMASPVTAFKKIDQVLEAGHRPLVVVAHALPEDALRNTLGRFSNEGRGAGIGVMADILSKTPASLEQVRDKYGDRVDFVVNDNRARAAPQVLRGWEYLGILGSEGTRENIEYRLRVELERNRGAISVEAFRQAHGAAPLGPYLGLAREGQPGQPTDAERSRLSSQGRAAAFVHATRADALKAYPDLAAAYQVLDAVAAKRSGVYGSLKDTQVLTAKAQELLHGQMRQQALVQQTGRKQAGPEWGI